MSRQGTLFVVATPIGNLEDITLRARRVLSEVGLVAAEDTRRTRKLLSHLGLSKPMISCYEPKEEKAVPEILAHLKQGEGVALVTDGGTPGISDPGYRLVRAAREAGILVTPVPGPSALAAALSASGLPTDLVTFVGFLPTKKGAREKALKELAQRRDTLIFYESPKRLGRFLGEALAILGDREAMVLRELTKIHEEAMGNTLSEILNKLEDVEVKGEVTVVVGGAAAADVFSDGDLEKLVKDELSRGGRSLRDLAAGLARETGVQRKKIYSLALKLKKD